MGEGKLGRGDQICDDQHKPWGKTTHGGGKSDTQKMFKNGPKPQITGEDTLSKGGWEVIQRLNNYFKIDHSQTKREHI